VVNDPRLIPEPVAIDSVLSNFVIPARGLLYGLNGVDIVSVGSVSLLFFAIALLAAYPPARHAMRVDPIVALRHE
jgi:ABC-type antimicrobial peptide transport system permease subunit